jgi:hypothetical protein
MEGSPEISEPRARPVKRGRKKGEGEKGRCQVGSPGQREGEGNGRG